MSDGIIASTRRVKRTWYRRRLRVQRISLAAVIGMLLVGACWQNAARYFPLPTLHVAQLFPDSFSKRGNIRKDLALMAARSARSTKGFAGLPGVYPYSVVPGGVKDPNDLRYAALRDYVVRRHYARFDYSNAHLVRVTEPREVYLSYRILNNVFWTRKKVRLHPGELLLTDGKITARARCGNQVSDTAKPEVSKDEPEEDVLDQPVAALEPGPSLPVRPLLSPADFPGGQPTPPQLFAGNFIFPYAPVGLPFPSGKCRANYQRVDGTCIPKQHRPVAPEPSTILLAATGMAFIVWRYRNRRAMLT